MKTGGATPEVWWELLRAVPCCGCYCEQLAFRLIPSDGFDGVCEAWHEINAKVMVEPQPPLLVYTTQTCKSDQN